MNLEEFLEYSGMTQINLAKRAKLTQSTIFKILSGRDVKLSTAVKLCEASRNKITLESLAKNLASAKKKANSTKSNKDNSPESQDENPKI